MVNHIVKEIRKYFSNQRNSCVSGFRRELINPTDKKAPILILKKKKKKKV